MKKTVKRATMTCGIIDVEPTVGDVRYTKALKAIRSSGVVNKVMVSFLDSNKANLCGEIKTIKTSMPESKDVRVLVLNENSSYEAITAALNVLSRRVKNPKLKEELNTNRTFKLVTKY